MKKTLSLIMAVLLICFCGTVGAANENEAKNSTGASVLGFSSVNIVTGETVTSDIIANTTLTLINEWAYWCSPCMSEMPHLQAAHEYYSATPEADVQIIGCAYDTSIAQGQNVLNSNGYTWVNVMEDTVLGNIFSTEGYIPQTIIVDRNGVVRDHIVNSFSSLNELRNYIDGWLEILQAEEGPALVGDVDGNGVVNASDALLIMRMALGQMECTDLAAADADGNGIVQSADALMVLRIAMGLADA